MFNPNKMLTAICLIGMSAITSQVVAFEDELLSAYGDEALISIATGTEKAIAKAPSVATVITAQDILATGASDLDEILETVPGLHVALSHVGYEALYTIRGIFSERNPQVLLLINGIPMTSAHFGNRNNTWGGMPVRNIERIEIIRGPGSSVYGADAFAGVINVITKDYDSMENEIGFRIGSFDTQEAWWLQKFQIGELKTAMSLELLHTNGHAEDITADAQTVLFDSVSPFPPASLAPGSVNNEKESLEAHINMELYDFTLHVGYQGRYDMGTGAGVNLALDPDGELDGYRFIADLAYGYVPESSPWELGVRLSFLQLEDNGETNLFPPNGGPILPPPMGPVILYPAGVIGNPSISERHYRAGLTAGFSGFDSHHIRAGAGIIIDDMHDVEEEKNFDANFLPLPGVIDVSDNEDLVLVEPVSRRIYYAFAQDEWAFAQNWDLTLGVRFDNYSDFGNTINPRAALVWQTTETITSKLLYGRAFRAPSFSEQGLKNNFVAEGNSDLDPETIDTIELAINYAPVSEFEINANVFLYEMQDILRFVADTGSKRMAQNTGRQTGYGVETDFIWKIIDSVTLRANYAYQNSRDDTNNTDAGNAPHHQLYTRLDYNFCDDWYLNIQSFWIGEQDRTFDDLRNDVEDYFTADITLRYDNKDTFWGASATVRNVFNNVAREPSIAPGLIPDDLPTEGRAFFISGSIFL